eukprot:66797-Pyramimonas_sp.AAC.1
MLYRQAERAGRSPAGYSALSAQTVGCSIYAPRVCKHDGSSLNVPYENVLRCDDFRSSRAERDGRTRRAKRGIDNCHGSHYALYQRELPYWPLKFGRVGWKAENTIPSETPIAPHSDRITCCIIRVCLNGCPTPNPYPELPRPAQSTENICVMRTEFM